MQEKMMFNMTGPSVTENDVSMVFQLQN